MHTNVLVAKGVQQKTHATTGHRLLWLGLALTLLGALTYFVQQTPIMADIDTRLPGLYACLLGTVLSTIGYARERMQHKKWTQQLGLKIVPLGLALTLLYSHATYGKFRQEEVQITNGGITLAGTLLIPSGPGPHPALAMMHGSGPALRMGNYAEAQSLARHGIAVLIYDKRGSGASVGGHPRLDGYAALASDGVAALDYLRSHPDLDPTRLGLWGTSEAGWTAPLAAAQIPDLAFLVIVSGGPLTPVEQGAYEMTYRLRARGFSEEMIEEARALQAQVQAYYRTRTGRDAVVAALKEAQDEPWFAAAEVSPSVPRRADFTDWDRWWISHMDLDVSPALAALECPILFVLGANDALIPAQQVQEQVDGILTAAGHPDFTIRVFPDATHNLIYAPDSCRVCVPDPNLGPLLPWFTPGYLEAVAEWVTARVEQTG